MFVNYSGQFFWNLTKSKEYGIVLFQHSIENKNYYDQEEIIDLMREYSHSKVLLIPWTEFKKFNSKHIVQKPTEILYIGNNICKKLNLTSNIGLKDIISENDAINKAFELIYSDLGSKKIYQEESLEFLKNFRNNIFLETKIEPPKKKRNRKSAGCENCKSNERMKNLGKNFVSSIAVRFLLKRNLVNLFLTKKT